MKRLLLLSALASSMAACSNGDCSIETCANGAKYQSCVEGSDLVVRDAADEEYSRCETDYEMVDGVSIGNDRNDCALKHAQSKTDFCNHAPASTASSGGTAGGRTCWTDPAESLCNCDLASEASSTGKKVPACDMSVFGSPLRCIQYSSGLCGCTPIGCDVSGGSRCTCGPSSASQPRNGSTCTGYEWYCAKDNGSECYGGNGNFGSACANGEHNVSSCSVTAVQGDKNTCQ